MKWRQFGKSVFAAALIGLAALGGPSGAADVSVSGGTFLLDGKPWMAEGVVLVGLLAPAENFERPAYAEAYKQFGPDLLNEIREFGADTVRLKARQEALDPESQYYLPDYRAEVVRTVKEVRNKNFIVIVSMLSLRGRAARNLPNDPKGQGHMPTASTIRAWLSIVGDIGQDRGVMLEIFDEPSLKDITAENWAKWQESMQSVVNALRKSGAKNVLLVDGLRSAHVLGGSPTIHDPLNQIGFAVHPYLNRRNRTATQWEKNFGEFARSHPVMATEWNALSNRRAQCTPDTPQTVQQFFSYLQELRIGLVLWAFDLPGVRRNGKLTSLENHQCGERSEEAKSGAGEAVREYFQAH